MVSNCKIKISWPWEDRFECIGNDRKIFVDGQLVAVTLDRDRFDKDIPLSQERLNPKKSSTLSESTLAKMRCFCHGSSLRPSH